MQTLKIKYRTWLKGIPPRKTKLEIPGWAGEPNDHTNGDRPQPWHCLPFCESAVYGLELCYPFDTECHIKIINGKIVFEGDFREENKSCPDIPLPPFLAFAPGHFGMTSAVDIQVPTGYILRLEPHPRFYTDITNTVPCCLAGHLQTDWWPKIFFVVFKNPTPGQTIIFRKGEPFGQALVLPRKIQYQIEEMTEQEKIQRGMADHKMDAIQDQFIKNDWKDHRGHNFNDKYKQLSRIANKGGAEAIKQFLSQFKEKTNSPKSEAPKKPYKGKLLRRTQ